MTVQTPLAAGGGRAVNDEHAQDFCPVGAFAGGGQARAEEVIEVKASPELIAHRQAPHWRGRSRRGESRRTRRAAVPSAGGSRSEGNNVSWRDSPGSSSKTITVRSQAGRRLSLSCLGSARPSGNPAGWPSPLRSVARMRRVALSDFAALLCPCHTWLKPLFPRQNQVYPIRERKRFPNHRLPSWILTLIQGLALPPSSYFSGRSRMERSSTTLKQPNQSSREAKMRVKTDPARAIIPIPPKLSDFIAKTPRSNRRSQSFLNHLLRDLLGSSRLRVKNLNGSAIWYNEIAGQGAGWLNSARAIA